MVCIDDIIHCSHKIETFDFTVLYYDRQAVRAVINVYLFIEHVIGNEAAASSQIKHYVIHIDFDIHAQRMGCCRFIDYQPLDNGYTTIGMCVFD